MAEVKGWVWVMAKAEVTELGLAWEMVQHMS
jgi:hypothetical protein